MLFKNQKISQISVEYLILIGIVLVIAIITSYFIFRPKQSASMDEAEETISLIASTVNEVTKLGPGNKIQLKINLPDILDEVVNTDDELTFKLFKDTNLNSNISYSTLAKTTGFFDGQLKPGIYELIFESFGYSVCIYTPENRSDYCTCVKNDMTDQYPTVSKVFCTTQEQINGQCDSLDLVYGDKIEQFNATCKANNNIINGYVIFRVTNWKNEIVYEGTTHKNINGNFVLNDTYVIENSGNLNFTATCYHECSSFRPEIDQLISKSVTTASIPYGQIVPFLLNKIGNEIYTTNINKPLIYLINPSNENKNYYEDGYVKSGDVFVVRTGYKCVGGECININATLWQAGTN